ncbi:tetratricopeptide repeat protein [Limibaculum sp. M0105]|uniref:Tetratricopeptide repeat protein n=1 Tax=Thermohalobaculum xanthum TaxID=2753746 RepID=A0A8J7MB40_9RHOB|nr:adenylate/guanylate cyclase domain-containing protein [Thermohalobaculum xanthum]MBK0400972.1 tetratricopeptide repeat protein [Thermohalobaculum xanthum]
MTPLKVDRRLAAILAADVEGYSKFVAEDEENTLAELRQLRESVIVPMITDHGGRLVKTTGDGFLAEFASAVDAVRAALGMQGLLSTRDSGLVMRIGVNVGDIVIEGDDILGDGVNIAARLEAIADPGGIAVSGAVHDYVQGRIDEVFEDGGRCELKNIERPIQVWRWCPEGAAPSARRRSAQPLPPDKPSIAVLPFDNMSGDPEQEYFADGVVESITAALCRIRAFFVIARNSAFAYKGRHLNVRDIGRELGVAYVLEGSVQRAGNRVRITVQLIETADGGHLWAERYDGSVDDIFDLQDRITEQVAGALQPSIRQAEIERARRKRPQELGAYDYTMRAMRHVWTLEKDAATAALELLDQALEIDPDYPLALALAAWCWAQRSVYNWVQDTAGARAKALSLADRAASHSTDDPLILAVLGAVNTFARNYGVARVLLERAVTLDPNAAWALCRLGWLEVYTDRPDEAEQHFRKALRLSPLDPMNFNNYVGLASARQVVGDDAAAADLFIRALEERPNALWIHRNLAASLLAAGREAEAQASRDVLLKAYPGFTTQMFREAMVFSPRVLDRLCALLQRLGVPE